MPSSGKGIPPLAVLFPLVLSTVAFVLAMIALFAGTGPQSQELETYHIVSVNMSLIGENLITTATSSAPEPTATNDEDNDDSDDDGDDDDDSWLPFVKRDLIDDAEEKLDEWGNNVNETWQDVENALTEELNDMVGDAVDNLAEVLGIAQWYSFHVMNWCEGTFAPNATNPNAWYNTTECTARGPGAYLNLTALLDTEIEIGAFSVNPAEVLTIPDSVKKGMKTINDALMALFIFYVLGSGFAGLSMILSAVSLVFFWSHQKKSFENPLHKKTTWVNLLLSGLSALCLLVGSTITTVAAKQAASEINEQGKDFGLVANAGMKFIIITWIAFAFMFASFFFWLSPLMFACLRKRRAAKATEKSGGNPEMSYARASSDSAGGLLGKLGLRRGN